MSDWVIYYFEMLKIEYRCCQQIQTTITFDSDVQLSPLIIQDARNWKQKLWANSNDTMFLQESPIESCCISRLKKLKTETLSKIQATITFYSDVRLIPVIYRDSCNWKQKLWGNSNDNNFWLKCPIVSCNISRRSKFRTETIRKIKRW